MLVDRNSVIGNFADCPLDVALRIVEVTQCTTNLMRAVRIYVVSRPP